MPYFVLTIVVALVFFFVLYLVVKAAVRDGIREARQPDNPPEPDDAEDRIARTTCPSCGAEHDMNLPRCPFCKHRYG